MNLLRLIGFSAIGAFLLLGCGGGSGADELARDILSGKTFYECQESDTLMFGEEVYRGISFTSDEIRKAYFRVADYTQLDRNGDGIIDDRDFKKANVTYSGNVLHIDDGGGIDCIVSDKGSYVESVCTDAGGAGTIKIYKTKDDAIANCVPAP